jgi:acetylornithine deacetylase
MDTVESRVLAQVDRLAGEIAELASQLIRVPSTSPNLVPDPASVLGGEAACNRLVADALADSGLQVDLVEPAPGRVNVVGVLAGGGGGRSLALNGHVDTVPPGSEADWTVDPYGGEIRDGQIWGRGATDMKGGLAAIVGAVRAIVRCGVRLRGDLVVQSVVGEELRDPEGVRSVLERGYVTDGCICAEPSVELRGGRQLAVHVISSPAVLLRVTLRGRSTHSCLRHEWIHPGGRAGIGVNAIEKGVDLVKALQELERAWGLEKRHPLFPPGKFFLHPGFFHGGPEHGSGPYLPAERCVVEYIIWHHPDDTADDVKREVGEWIARWASLDPWLVEHPPELEWWGDFAHHALDPDHELVRAVAAAHERAVGAPARIGAFPAGADATVLAEFGVPTLIYGPGEIAMAHAVDEHVAVDELVQAAKVYAVAALSWCGAAQ